MTDERVVHMDRYNPDDPGVLCGAPNPGGLLGHFVGTLWTATCESCKAVAHANIAAMRARLAEPGPSAARDGGPSAGGLGA